MVIRSFMVWFGLLGLAILNGAFREAILTPRVGASLGHVISTLSLCVLILLLTFGSIAWIGPADSSAAWVIGGTWMVLTLAFEFLAGHYLFHASWSALAADYDVLHGRIWILVLVTTGVAPALADNWRRTIA